MDILVAPLGVLRVPAGQANHIVVQPQDGVGALIEFHHGLEFGLHLLRRAVDVRVVHAHAAHPQQPAHRAGILPAIDLPVFRQPQRQVPVAARLGGIDLVMVRAVHGAQSVGFLQGFGALAAFQHLHGRVHVVRVVGQVAGLAVQRLLGQVRGGHPLVAGLEFQFPGQLLQFVPKHGAVRQPERQAPADVVVDGENAQGAAQLLVIPGLGFLPAGQMFFQRLFAGEGPGVDAGHHGIAGIAPPVGAGDAAQLERIARQLGRVLDMGAFAHVQERAVAVEGKALEPLLLDQFRPVLPLVGFAHLLDALQGGLGIEFLPIEALALLEDFPHAPLDLGEILLGQGRAQHEIVVEAIGNGRPEAQRGARPHFQHRLRQHMRQAMANAVQRIVRRFPAALFQFAHPAIPPAPSRSPERENKPPTIVNPKAPEHMPEPPVPA